MSACAGCGAAPLVPVFSLGRMPPVNAFVTPAEAAREESFPLDVHLCPACTLLQLHPTVAPARLFADYTYLSATSRTTVAYLGRLAESLAVKLALTTSSKILEIGSNDGTLLAALRAFSPGVLGIDPAENVAARANADGIPTRVAFFSAAVAAALRVEVGAFDLVAALNVVAHTPDFVDLLAGVHALLAPGGTFVMECVHVMQTILRGAIDTVYHEHVYCFSLHALVRAYARVGLVIVDVETTRAQGGSLRVFARAAADAPAVAASVADLLRVEEEAGVTRLETYAAVGQLAETLRREVPARLRALRGDARLVVGLGASARGVVLLNHCGLGPDDLDFVVDDTPLKQGKLVPGRHIPVHDWTRIPRGEEVVCLLLSWNYRDEVLAKLRARTSHARVLVPLPVLEEITLES
ncbi:MAG: class SAM-dependent methyltransferase [Myxococcales bacterium]|nr:class SAM-dependent methyltransferase [Myxococcales bacterium]